MSYSLQTRIRELSESESGVEVIVLDRIQMGQGQLLRHKMLFMNAESGMAEVLEIGGHG